MMAAQLSEESDKPRGEITSLFEHRLEPLNEHEYATAQKHKHEGEFTEGINDCNLCESTSLVKEFQSSEDCTLSQGIMPCK